MSGTLPSAKNNQIELRLFEETSAMRLRKLLQIHAASLGWNANQAMHTAAVLGQGEAADAFAAKGLGPGGGPEATPYNCALLVLAALAGGIQTRASAATHALYSVPLEGTPEDTADIAGPNSLAEAQALFGALPRCPVTGAGCFGDALSVILGDPELAGTVAGVKVERGAIVATLCMRDGRRVRFVAGPAPSDADAGKLRVLATLGGNVLAAVALDLRTGGAA